MAKPAKKARSKPGPQPRLDDAEAIVAGRWWVELMRRTVTQGWAASPPADEFNSWRREFLRSVLWVREPEVWFRLFEGYEAAWDSAEAALFLLWGRTPTVRDAYRARQTYAPNDPRRLMAGILAVAHHPQMQIGEAVTLVRHLLESAGPPKARQEFDRLLRQAQARSDRNLLAPIWCPPGLNEICATSRELVRFWVSGHYWLARNFEDIAACLNRAEVPAARGGTQAVFTGPNLSRLANELRLVRYKGPATIEIRNGKLSVTTGAGEITASEVFLNRKPLSDNEKG